jgi:AcrR family transcriptional regulator
MRRIAREAGIPTMTIYSHFPSRVAVIRGVWSLAFDPLFQKLDDVAAAHADPLERLIAVSAAYVGYWIAFPDFYRIVFLIEDRREDGDGDWFVSQSGVVGSYLRFADWIAQARMAQVAGAPDTDCTTEAEALISALTGVAHMCVTVSEYSWKSPETYAALIARGIVGGSLPA